MESALVVGWPKVVVEFEAREDRASLSGWSAQVNCRVMAAAARHGVVRRAPALIGAAAVMLASLAIAEDRKSAALEPLHEMVGTMSCMSASCHGGSEPRQGVDGWPRHAYVRWLEGGEGTFQDGRRGYDPRARLERADADPHALAAQRMMEPRFQEVLRLASGQGDGSADEAMRKRCAACHDPVGAPDSSRHTPRDERVTRSVTNTMSGIGCESCHGGARRWIAVHYER